MVNTFPATLHLLTASPRHWPVLLPQIKALWQDGDQLLLVGEAAQSHTHPDLAAFGRTALLQADLDALLQPIVNSTTDIITHDTWATWTLHYPKSLTWRA